VQFHRRIASFFKEYYPDIRLASELEKEVAVQRLAGSKAFVSTHSAVAKLDKYEDFSQTQANAIVDAALNNTQVNWILRDYDVFEFLTKLIKKYDDKIDEMALEQLKKELAAYEPSEEDDDDFPF
jgi:hypothetical protein